MERNSLQRENSIALKTLRKILEDMEFLRNEKE